jgi:hypothetical protein
LDGALRAPGGLHSVIGTGSAYTDTHLPIQRHEMHRHINRITLFIALVTTPLNVISHNPTSQRQADTPVGLGADRNTIVQGFKNSSPEGGAASINPRLRP